MGAFSAERKWVGRRGADWAGYSRADLREARDDRSSQGDGAITALGMCRVRSSPATRRTERKRSPEEPGPKGNAQLNQLQSSQPVTLRTEELPPFQVLQLSLIHV